jgi:hypothetical protein
MEGKWLRNVFEEVCAEGKLDESTTNRVIEHIGMLNKTLDGLGFCLSEEGDMLSQWRGYAGDATGICIGFSKDYFEETAKAKQAAGEQGFSLIQVVYDPEAQKAAVKPTYDKIIEHIKEGALRLPGRRSLLDTRTQAQIEEEDEKLKRAFQNFSLRVLLLFPDLFRLKNPAFDEEREWRLISYLTQGGKDECKFRSSSDRIIPYREFEIPKKDIGPIDEVILGPKNLTPVSVIEAFLKQHGFEGIKVIRSKATYR